MNKVENGFYRHFKGSTYEVLGETTHTETNETLILYKSVGADKLYSRPIDMFLEEVTITGNLFPVPRFEKIMVFVIKTDFGYIGDNDDGTTFVGIEDAKYLASTTGDYTLELMKIYSVINPTIEKTHMKKRGK